MLWETSFSEENDAMPQTVPRSGRSPPAARPSDERAVPHSPPSLRRLLRLLGAASPPADQPIAPHSALDAHKLQIQEQHDANFLDQFYNFGYQSPLYPTPSPSSDESSIPSINVQPCSPFDQAAASYNTTDILGTHLNPIKEEPYSSLLSPSYSNSPYPLSPSESCISYLSDLSPQYYQPISPSQYPQRSVEEEYIDIENLLKENQILQESLGISIDHNNIQQNYLCNSDLLLTPKLEKDDRPKDHQLLREVLEDTSFQKRLNLKPVSFDDLGADFGNSPNAYIKMEEGETSEEMSQRSATLTNDKIDQVLSLAIEQTRKDVENTCTMLGISPDPVQWSSEDVKAWLLFQLRQYSLPLVPVEYFSMDGAKLAALTEEEFTQRAPQAGSTLHAQLEIWKAARHEGWPAPAPPAAAEPPAEPSDDEESESSGPSRAPTGKGGGAHIHLWQFLKELLAAPQLHAAAIRWLDRENGVFKIEDSVRVARLWGKRKNRPAMNYDKLSRSIRQYYKKGIMKKTERSQRLVYQFCHPYCL